MVAVLVSIIGLFATIAFGTASFAQTPRDSDDSEPSAQLRLQAIPALATPGETLPVRVQVTTDSNADDLEVAFRFGPEVRSRSEFESAADGEPSRSVLQLITADLVSASAAEEFAAEIAPEVAASGRTSDDRIVLRSDGVYPLTISVRESGSGDDIDSLTTFVVRMDDAIEAAQNPLRFAWIWPVYSPPPDEPGADDQLRDAMAAGGAIDTVASFASQTDMPVNLLVVPDTAQRAAAIAAARPEDTQLNRTLDSLVEAADTKELIASPFAHVATNAWAEVTPEADPQFARGAETIDTIFGVAPNRIAQVAVGVSVPTSGIRMLASQGASNVVIPSDALEDPGLNVTLTKPFQIADVDDILGARADPGLAASLGDSGGPVAAGQRLFADLTMLYTDAPGVTRGAVLSPEPSWTPSAALLREAIARIQVAPYIEPTTLTSLFDEVAAGEDGSGDPLELDLTDPDGRPPPEQAAQYQSTLAARARLNTFNSMVVSGPGLERPDVLLLESLDSALVESGNSSAYSQRATAIVDEMLARVETPAGQNITLTSRKATIPISIRNDGEFTLRVRIDLESSGLRFPDGETRELVLPPRTVTTEFAVETPSNGTYDVTIRVSSPDGSLAISQTTVEVRSTAVNGVALALSVGSVIFLLAWWVVHARRQRSTGKHVRRGRHPVFDKDASAAAVSAPHAPPAARADAPSGDSSGDPTEPASVP